MSVPVTYMGTKRQLADHVKAISAECRPGPFLDAFAGMCSVGSAIGAARPIWSNDKQTFAYLAAKARFTARSAPPRLDRVNNIFDKDIQKLISDKIAQAGENAWKEEKAIEARDVTSLNELYEMGREYKGFPSAPKRRLGVFSDRYAGTYFGFKQCAEIDTIRSLLDDARQSDKIDDDEHIWLIIALATAISKASTTTGHFAQPLRPKISNIAKFSAQRRRSILGEWQSAILNMKALGTRAWRSKNKVFQEDAERLIGDLRAERSRPSVIYADPPYTKDQYSRFYHIYETLVLNDNPSVSGEGLYREDRFTSQYSLASLVEDAIETLIAECAEIGADLILSYPTNGLLENSAEIIPSLFKKHYSRLPQAMQLPHIHSTLGGSKGKPRSAVTEAIYWVAGEC